MPGALSFATTDTSGSGPTERMRVDNSGNVGISSSNPLAQLHIVSASGSTGFYISRSNGSALGDQPSLRIIPDTSKTRIYGYGDSMTFWTAATVERQVLERMLSMMLKALIVVGCSITTTMTR